MFGAPAIRILSSSERHASFERAVNLLGLGQSNLKLLPVDSAGRLIPEALEAELQKDLKAPTLVLLQAGDINIGAYDSFETLIPIAQRHHAWVHVDGAFGLWARVAPSRAHLMAGIEHADSWATDGHKWLNVPYDSGIAFVRDGEALQASMSITAEYLPTVSELGYPGVAIQVWHGLLVPANTPHEVVQRLQDETLRALRQDENRLRLMQVGIDASSGTGDEFATLFRSDVEKYADVVKRAKLNME